MTRPPHGQLAWLHELAVSGPSRRPRGAVAGQCVEHGWTEIVYLLADDTVVTWDEMTRTQRQSRGIRSRDRLTDAGRAVLAALR